MWDDFSEKSTVAEALNSPESVFVELKPSVIFKESYIYNFYITFIFGFSELMKIEKLYRHFWKVIYITFGYL